MPATLAASSPGPHLCQQHLDHPRRLLLDDPGCDPVAVAEQLGEQQRHTDRGEAEAPIVGLVGRVEEVELGGHRRGELGDLLRGYPGGGQPGGELIGRNGLAQDRLQLVLELGVGEQAAVGIHGDIDGAVGDGAPGGGLRIELDGRGLSFGRRVPGRRHAPR